MLRKNSSSSVVQVSACSGQAMLELLPMFVIFFAAISGMVAYFQTMRNSILVQEAARNAAFAKIANSGPLVTPPEQVGQPLMAGPYERGPAAYQVSGANNNAVVGPGNSCFTVFPGESVIPERLPTIYGIASTVGETSRAVVYRFGGSACQ